MEDDFNTPKAMAVIFNLVRKVNFLIGKTEVSSSDAKEIIKFFRKIDEVFNFIFPEKSKEKTPERLLNRLLNLVKQRAQIRL